MESKQLILNYLKSNYDIVTDDMIRITSKWNGETFRFVDLIEEVDNIFAMSSSVICDKWFKERIAAVTADIQLYLKDYRVSLGKTNWITLDNKDNELNMTTMKRHFEGKYSEKFISTIYNEWYMAGIYEESEKLMKLNV